MTTFLLVVIGLGWFFSYYYGDPLILWFFVGFSIFMNLFSFWFSHKIVLRLAGAKEANREEHFDLYTIVENLSITAGLPMPKVYIVNDPAPNAFATGRSPKKAVVAVTTGLLAILERNELEGVMAHELSHIGNRDMLVSTIAVVLVGFVTILADVFIRSMHWGGRGNNRGGNAIAIIGLVFVVLSPIFAQLIHLAISRKREYLADASGAMLTRYPEGLANALKKISANSRPMQRKSKAIAHLYLADPRGSKIGKKVSGLFMTHPPVESRIKALIG